MRTHITPDQITLWLSKRDTYDWAHRANASWPCSTIAGKSLCASFDDNGLYNITINGRDTGEVDGHEFNAITSDFLRAKLPEAHPLYFVTVGQFQGVCSFFGSGHSAEIMFHPSNRS